MCLECGRSEQVSTCALLAVRLRVCGCAFMQGARRVCEEQYGVYGLDDSALGGVRLSGSGSATEDGVAESVKALFTLGCRLPDWVVGIGMHVVESATSVASVSTTGEWERVASCLCIPVSGSERTCFCTRATGMV